jgi:hypothetical protein
MQRVNTLVAPSANRVSPADRPGSRASEVKDDHVTLLSAGIAFYALLALVPALIAIISVYGLIADPAEMHAQILDSLSAAPRENDHRPPCRAAGG